jgi:hypothetical protein
VVHLICVCMSFALCVLTERRAIDQLEEKIKKMPEYAEPALPPQLLIKPDVVQKLFVGDTKLQRVASLPLNAQLLLAVLVKNLKGVNSLTQSKVRIAFCFVLRAWCLVLRASR